MFKRTMIILDPEEKRILRQAGQIMKDLCETADSCDECPLKGCDFCQSLNGQDYGDALTREI